MEVATWILTTACLVGTILNVKKIKYCFWIWAVTNTLWFSYDLYTGLYSRMCLDGIQFALAVWGIISWQRKQK